MTLKGPTPTIVVEGHRVSTGSGEKPAAGSSPGRPAADTPQRVVVRSSDVGTDSMLGANDTAVAVAVDSRTSTTMAAAGGASAQARAESELIGTTLSGRYLVTRKVGQGGMGAVYEATHTLIGKRVAVKVLLEKYAQREAIVARLKQEAQLASSVGNEHIIDITDFGTTEDGRTFVVMEFLEGESLAECLARETKLPEQRLLRIASQTSSALAAAHAKGIVHRDVKPENLFLLKRKEQDFVKVVDFGISKSLRASSEEEDQPRLTQTGMVLGTPLYMSPEQARGDDELDQRVDIYALGVILYEASTGRVPFIGNNYLSVISQVLNETPKPPRDLRPELSEEFESIVLRAMAKNPNERYASAQEMLADITLLLDDPTHSTERAKITGPRRKILRGGGPKRSGLKIVVWIAAISVIVMGIVVSVTLAMRTETDEKKLAAGSDKLVAPPPIPMDAAPVADPIDAAPAKPAYQIVKIQIESTPPGAHVVGVEDGLDHGITPFPLEMVLKDEKVKYIAQHEGYDDKPFAINAATQQDSGAVRFSMVKAVGRAANTVKMIAKPGAGSAGSGSGSSGSATGSGSAQSKSNGELGGYHPELGGGTMNK